MQYEIKTMTIQRRMRIITIMVYMYKRMPSTQNRIALNSICCTVTLQTCFKQAERINWTAMTVLLWPFAIRAYMADQHAWLIGFGWMIWGFSSIAANGEKHLLLANTSVLIYIIQWHIMFFFLQPSIALFLLNTKTVNVPEKGRAEKQRKEVVIFIVCHLYNFFLSIHINCSYAIFCLRAFIVTM